MAESFPILSVPELIDRCHEAGIPSSLVHDVHRREGEDGLWKLLKAKLAAVQTSVPSEPKL